MTDRILSICLIFVYVVAILGNFYYVDKQRKPTTFAVAVIASGIAVVNIWLLWRAYL